ncbi:MAG TPA: hypothetical protein VEL79_01935 [Vicinamibacterales bacterium]|nr:hypothetical protein [Vicinamibacterales bacterium]
MSVRTWLTATALAACVAAATPRNASADWVFTPFLGVNFGGSADVNGGGATFSQKFQHKADFGASLAGMGGGVLGMEVDFGYSPNFFATPSSGYQFTSKSNVTTLTANLIVGAPLHGRHNQIRPYVVGGLGLMRSNVQDAAQLFDVTTKNDLGLDVGGGVMGYFSKNVGLRGDVRYFRGLRGSSNTATGLGLSNFEFWRGSLGVSFKF